MIGDHDRSVAMDMKARGRRRERNNLNRQGSSKYSSALLASSCALD
jgi:hypothetical protein